MQHVTPDRHPATARTQQLIACWNVRTLYQKGKLDNVVLEMDRMKINILGIAETRWQGTKSIKHKGKFMIYSGGDTHERGVGIIFDETTQKSLDSWFPVSDRIIVAKIKAKPFDIGTIQVYTPTSERPEEEVEEFYEDLDKAKKYLKSQSTQIIMGDFNAKVGSDKVENIVGPCGKGDTNERGEKLIEWCKANDLTVTNTWFKHHPRRQWTWMSPGDRTRNKIDYILIQNRFRNSIKSSKSMPGADCDSDHAPVLCKLLVKLRKLKKPNHNCKLNSTS